MRIPAPLSTLLRFVLRLSLSLRRSLPPSLSVLALLCAMTRPARADSNVVKGIVGGGMMGSEIVMITESALRIRPGWAYLVGGAAGAGAGAYLGYELSNDGSNRPPSFLLAGGIALVIPTIMGVMTATQYAPPESHREDAPLPVDGDAPEDASDAPDAHLEFPTVAVAQTFSRQQRAEIGAPNVTELHFMLLNGKF
jgi:hypothetical protein